MKNETQSKRHKGLASLIVIVLGFYLVITSTFYPLSSLMVYDAKRIIQVFLIAGCILFANIWAPLRLQALRQLSRLSTLSRVLLALFFTIGIVSSLRLAHPAYALVDVSMLFLLLCMIAITAASRDLAPDSFDKWAVALLSVLGLAVFVQELMGFVAGWVLGSEFSYRQALIHFAHPRFYNQLQTWSIPIIAALPIMFPKRTWLKPACVILLGLQWFLVISLAARGTVASLAIAGLFVALWLPRSRQYWLKVQILGVVAGIAIYCVFLLLNSILIPQSQSGTFYSYSVGRSMMHTSGRINIWKHSINDALNNPWFGSGPAEFACGSPSWLPAHPHSFPMQILGEWGISAAILLIILGLVIGLRYLNFLRSTSETRIKSSALNTVLAISLLAGLIHTGLSGLIVMPASQMCFALFGGWVLSLSLTKKVEYQYSAPAHAILLVPSVIALLLFAFSLHELKHLYSDTPNLKLYGPSKPRYWQVNRVCEYINNESGQP